MTKECKQGTVKVGTGRKGGRKGRKGGDEKGMYARDCGDCSRKEKEKGKEGSQVSGKS